MAKLSRMEMLREDFKIFLEEEGFNETINDDFNEKIENCGVEFGKYAMMRKLYLEENHWEHYFSIVASGDFIEHFKNVDKRASEMFDRLFKSYVEKFQNEIVARSYLEEFLISEIVEDSKFEEEMFNREVKSFEDWTEEEVSNLPF